MFDGLWSDVKLKDEISGDFEAIRITEAKKYDINN